MEKYNREEFEEVMSISAELLRLLKVVEDLDLLL